MKAKRVAIYVRVSTTEQETEGQEAELREYVDSRGWTYEVYRDKGQSGAKSDRPELNRLVADLRKRKLDIVVVWALDRLARSLRHLLEIAEQCQSLGVDLVSLRQNIDTTMPAGRLTFQILGAVARIRTRNASRTSEGGDGTSSPDRKEDGETCTAVLHQLGCRSVTGVAFPRHQRPQTGKGIWDHTVDGSEANGAYFRGGLLKGIPFLRPCQVQYG
jgi:hypothetical protein